MFAREITVVTTATFIMFSMSANAETLIKEVTTITPQEIEGTNMIEMSVFDQNGDDILSMQEVGAKLFDIFDRDGNRVIDNIEYRQNSLMTIAPMEIETLTFIDTEADGDIDQAIYSQEEFIKASQLSRFEEGLDGLSPEEFMDLSFIALDDNDDKVIDLQEWEESYGELVKPAHEENERYNG